LDQKIATAASREGATFKDQSFVQSVKFDTDQQVWIISVQNAVNLNKPFGNYIYLHYSLYVVYRAKVVIAADGADSRIARSLGIVTTKPETMAGRCYGNENTHALRAGHVRFYPKNLLPGHVVMANGANGILNVSCFVLPGGTATPQELASIFSKAVSTDPLISKALGPNIALGPIHIAPLRVRTVPKMYGNQFLIIGEAAGQVDPLTGGKMKYIEIV
jgi:flavin-dependent dehydrogenase